ncbi:pleckstrin homology domain-containing family F member 2 [Nothobranchius furzeri]|uniref:Pleckstrin homology and FYVE domain containing 1 n=3 Tax=Nothobranchius furzeri TaxID=105023 RepID=A0A8C6NUH7_NOTFU|nr:pleckstrin homology domain-containing family F member 2 [Nothobranchius furzeri]KAF7220673.1 pleckstrin homology domain-containing family F member 2-like [Nothobranchius furzeri]
MDLLTTEKENQRRIRKLEQAFGPKGMALSLNGRILMGEGKLMKRGRKKWQQRAFFLFNDIIMYCGVIMNKRLYKKQKVIALEDIKVKDMEDSEDTKHQWMICTPRKSFFVSASCNEEKQAWMENIRKCQCSLLQGSNIKPGSSFAISWIPDQATTICMRCWVKFTATNRRHHCRKCGFVVCNQCSKERELIENIHPTKEVRICKVCNEKVDDAENNQESNRHRGDSSGMHSSEDDDGEEEPLQVSSNWPGANNCTWS